MPDTAPTPRLPGPRDAALAVAVLTAMNLLNYVDRYVPSAVKDLFKAELGLTDAQTSYPLSAFVVVYMLASPIFGALADRAPRRLLIAGGVALWSAATAAAAFAHTFWTFLAARALVGVGEAAYATLAPSLMSDYYPPEKRNRVLTLFYVAIPVGAAIGFTAGGALGAAYGWRQAFLVCGLPGIVAAIAVLFVKEPPRGRFDAPVDRAAPAMSWKRALALLRTNRAYVLTVLGYTAVTFGSGALADWFPTFLARERHLDLAEAGRIVGTTSVIGGLAGTACGGWLAERLKGRTRQPYLAVSAASMALATVCVVLALLVKESWAVWATLLAGQFLLWFYNGPVNAILVNCVGSDLRARAFSLSILAIHLFGDALSPSLVGAVSDAASLPVGLALVPVSFVVGALVWAVGWRSLPEAEAA